MHAHAHAHAHVVHVHVVVVHVHVVYVVVFVTHVCSKCYSCLLEMVFVTHVCRKVSVVRRFVLEYRCGNGPAALASVASGRCAS